MGGIYTLELYSDPAWLPRMVPTSPVLPQCPAPFRNASAGPRVVTGSTIARSPWVRLRLTILSAGFPVSALQPPRLARALVAQSCPFEWSRSRHYNRQRSVVKVDISGCPPCVASGFTRTTLPQSHPIGKLDDGPSGPRYHVMGVGAPRFTVSVAGAPRLAVHGGLQV